MKSGMTVQMPLRRSPRRVVNKATISYKEEEVEHEEDEDQIVEATYNEKKKSPAEQQVLKQKSTSKNHAKQEDIYKEFECPICLEVLNDPYLIPECCHRFCCKCIHQSILSGNNECPTCRVHITTKRSLRKDTMVGSLLKIVGDMEQQNKESRQEGYPQYGDCSGDGTQSEIPTTKEEHDAPNSRNKRRKKVSLQSKKSCATKLDMEQELCSAKILHNESNSEKRKNQETSKNTHRSNKKVRTQNKAVEEKIWTQSAFKKLSFEERLNELAKYKEVHGHCNVSQGDTKNTSLAYWVYKLRQTRHDGKKGYKKFKLTPTNIAKLDELGFRWVTSKTFEEHLHDLKEYKARNGDCNVPYKYKDNPTLGVWCKSMNFNYRLIQQGKKPLRQLNQEMIDKLESMGFSWKESSRRRTFEEYLSDLKEFKRKHGHCNVKWKYKENPKLAEWCVGIRKAYKYFVAGKKAPSYNLTPSMVEQLEQLGFIFKKVTSADEYILDLQTFKNEHGHCNVPRRYKDNPKLGSWVANTRTAYKVVQAGKKPKNRITPSTINQLNDMGFSWQGIRGQYH